MAWALAAIVILGVGVPIAAWSYTRLHSPPPVTPLGTGYDQIDKWLLEQHRLPPLDRERVRKAVGQGCQVDNPVLASAAHDLAAQILAGKFRVVRLLPVLGWVNMIAAVGFAAVGLVLLAASHNAGGFVLATLALIDCGLFTFVGLVRVRSVKKIRDRATMAQQANPPEP
jgi:hypothetical protein